MAPHPRPRPCPTALLTAALLTLGAAGAWAGTLDAPAAPSSQDSAMYILEDIYNRLNANTLGSKRPKGLEELTTGPGATGHTLNEVYAKAILTQVPQTGQTPTLPINPAPDGSDGALHKGFTRPSPRFTDNNNGTVTDNLTGLIWLKNANCPQGKRDWATALSDVTSLNSTGTMNGSSCGDTSKNGSHQSDWRLPNIKELLSLADYGYKTPALSNTAGGGQWAENNPFTGVQANGAETYKTSGYWSSSSYKPSPSSVWVLAFSNGCTYYPGKTATIYVWPVRGGQ